MDGTSSSIMSGEASAMEGATSSSSRRRSSGHHHHHHHHSHHVKSPEAISSRKSTVTATTATISTAAESTTTGGGGKSKSSSRRTSSQTRRGSPVEETKSNRKEEENQEEMITPEILNERMKVLLELLMAAKADNMEQLREVERKASSKLGSSWLSSSAHPYSSSSSRSSSRRGKDYHTEEKEADGPKGNSPTLAGDIEGILRMLEKARRDEPTTRKLEITEGGQTTTIIVPLASHSSAAVGGGNGSYPRRNSTGSTTTAEDTPFSDVEFGNNEMGSRKNGTADRIGRSQRSTPSSAGRSREAPEARPTSLSSSRRSASTGQRGGSARSGNENRKHHRQRSAGGDADLDAAAAIAPLSLSRARTAPHHSDAPPSVQHAARSQIRSNRSPSPSQPREAPSLVDNVQDVHEDRLQRNIQMILSNSRSKKRPEESDVLEPSPLPGSGAILRRQQEEDHEEDKDVLDEEEDDIISASLPKRFGGNLNQDSMSVVSDLTTPTVMTYRDPPSVAGGAHDVPLTSSPGNPTYDRMPKHLGVPSGTEVTRQIQERRRRTRAELEEMNSRTKAAQQQALESRPSLEQGPPPPSRMDLVPGAGGLTPLRSSGGTPSSSTSRKVDLESAKADLGPLPFGSPTVAGAVAPGTGGGVTQFARTRTAAASPPGSGGVPFPTSLGRNVSSGGGTVSHNAKGGGPTHRRSNSTTDQPSAVNDASRVAAALRQSLPASGADRFASSSDKQPVAPTRPPAGMGHMKRHSAGGISSGAPVQPALRNSIPGQPPKPAKKPATDEAAAEKPLTLDDFADTAGESPNFFPTVVQDELSVYFEPTSASTSNSKSTEKGGKRSSIRDRLRLVGGGGGGGVGGSKEKKDTSHNSDGDAVAKKGESEEKSSGKGRRVSMGGAAAAFLGGRNRRGSEHHRGASTSHHHQKPAAQTAGSILRAGGELSSRNLLASGSSSRGAALTTLAPRTGGGIGNLSGSLHSAPPASRTSNTASTTATSPANPIDVEGVVSTMGKDIDYIFRELSALEAEQDRGGSGGNGNANNVVGVASIHPETAMSSTVRIKYTLGSVASVLRKGDTVDGGIANSSASRGQFSQYRRRGSQANLLASQRFLTHHGKKVSWGRIGSSRMELAPLEDVGEGAEEDEEATAAHSESQSRASSSAAPRRDPLLIDEDGFIISSASVSSSANESSQQDDAGADKKKDDRQRNFGVQQKQQSPSWWGDGGGGAGSPRSAKGRVSAREEESIREPKGADVEEKVITGPGEARITSTASPVVPTSIGGPAVPSGALGGSNSKESRIDAVEEATKNRIAILRKLVADRSRAGGAGNGDGLAAKLDFVELETMKQIGKLRDRLTSQRELGETRVSV